MMLGSFSLTRFISGAVSNGLAPSSRTSTFRSLFISKCSGRSQWAQEVSTLADRLRLSSCPCTKGAAKASIAQAAQISWPLLNISRCGVRAAVTG